jgi:hypothetical protein
MLEECYRLEGVELVLHLAERKYPAGGDVERGRGLKMKLK